jgi:tetratricopeptide (TPR) repeat protein
MNTKFKLLAATLQSVILLSSISAPSFAMQQIRMNAGSIQLKSMDASLDVRVPHALQGKAQHFEQRPRLDIALKKNRIRAGTSMNKLSLLQASRGYRLSAKRHHLQASHANYRLAIQTHILAVRGNAHRDLRGSSSKRMLAAGVTRKYDARQSLALERAFAGHARWFNLNAVKASCTCGGKGSLLLDQHKWNEAAAYYRAKLKDGSDKSNTLNNLAWSLAHSGQYAESLAKATEAIRELPDSSYPVGTRGYAHLRKKNLLQAKADLEKAVQLNPDGGGDWYYLALTYHQLHRYRESAEALRKAAALGYEDYDGDYRLASK